MLEIFIAEILGTFIFLCIVITFSVLETGKITPKHNDSFLWIKRGFALSIGILFVGFVSGAHLNPAVTFLFFLNNDIDIKNLIIYIIAQLIGAYFAYLYYLFIFK